MSPRGVARIERLRRHQRTHVGTEEVIAAEHPPRAGATPALPPGQRDATARMDQPA
jgi:hypothetical protein